MLQRAAIALCLTASTAAGEVRFSLPVDCDLGSTCYIQQYVDRDPGPGSRDFTCGSLTYDTHKGTDFALIDFAAMETGVAVLAAAPGTVDRLRDGVEDLGANGSVAGAECGNGIVIRHTSGYETQYCHLKRGSLSVKRGDKVRAGDPIAEVGLSGSTEFPHMHFAVRKDGDIVDPFAPGGPTECTASHSSLWVDDIPYVPGGLLKVGFAFQVPDYQAIKTDYDGETSLPETAPALVLWGYGFGALAGDRTYMIIDGPTGRFFENTVTFDRNQALHFRAGGKKRAGSTWAPGLYRGTFTVIRDNAVLDTMTVEIVAE